MIALPRHAVVNAYAGLVRVRASTEEERALFLSRQHQPRTFDLLDRGLSDECASAFIREACIGGLLFRVDSTADLTDPAGQIKQITGFLPE